jgi:membrane associated rhomboid family serine protease
MEPGHEPAGDPVVFRGSRSLCREYSLALEAKNINHETTQVEGAWILTVAPAMLHEAHEEISRYCAEGRIPRTTIPSIVAHPGAGLGAACYVVVLLLTAYCAGNGMFGVDWFAIGALDAGAPAQWWRSITALTLHLDQEHLLGNLLFGVVAGIASGRLLGPGVAWLSILGSAALANYAEVMLAPSTHRALGASTAVFAALGQLAGMASRQRLTLRERLWYRWAPLIAGICLLTLLGAGDAHVDVLGHALGFIFGTGVGWLYTRLGVSNKRGSAVQAVTGWIAGLAVCAAWALAIMRADG